MRTILKKYAGFVLFIVAVGAITICSSFKKYKLPVSTTDFTEFTLFDGTFKISSPFDLDEEALPNPDPATMEKVTAAGNQNKSMSLQINCYKLKPGVVFKDVDQRIKLVFKDIDRDRQAHSIIKKKDETTINNIKFTRISGVQKRDYSAATNKKADYNFEILFTLTHGRLYVIYFDENLNTEASQNLKKEILASLKIVNRS